MVATDEPGGHRDPLDRQHVRELPVRVEVAIEADRPEESRLLELRRVDVDVFLGQPRGQRLRHRGASIPGTHRDPGVVLRRSGSRALRA